MRPFVLSPGGRGKKGETISTRPNNGSRRVVLSCGLSKLGAAITPIGGVGHATTNRGRRPGAVRYGGQGGPARWSAPAR